MQETSPHKIMIIDDEEEIALLTKKLLQLNGYSVMCYPEGQGAIEEVKRLQPDLILLDILLPDLSGIEIFKMLRDDPATQSIATIFLTASNQQDSLRLKDLNATGFMLKPYDLPDLMTYIEKILLKI